MYLEIMCLLFITTSINARMPVRSQDDYIKSINKELSLWGDSENDRILTEPTGEKSQTPSDVDDEEDMWPTRPLKYLTHLTIPTREVVDQLDESAAESVNYAKPTTATDDTAAPTNTKTTEALVTVAPTNTKKRKNTIAPTKTEIIEDLTSITDVVNPPERRIYFKVSSETAASPMNTKIIRKTIASDDYEEENWADKTKNLETPTKTTKATFTTTDTKVLQNEGALYIESEESTKDTTGIEDKTTKTAFVNIFDIGNEHNDYDPSYRHRVESVVPKLYTVAPPEAVALYWRPRFLTKDTYSTTRNTYSNVTMIPGNTMVSFDLTSRINDDNITKRSSSVEPVTLLPRALDDDVIFEGLDGEIRRSLKELTDTERHKLSDLGQVLHSLSDEEREKFGSIVHGLEGMDPDDPQLLGEVARRYIGMSEGERSRFGDIVRRLHDMTDAERNKIGELINLVQNMSEEDRVKLGHVARRMLMSDIPQRRIFGFVLNAILWLINLGWSIFMFILRTIWYIITLPYRILMWLWNKKFGPKSTTAPTTTTTTTTTAPRIPRTKTPKTWNVKCHTCDVSSDTSCHEKFSMDDFQWYGHGSSSYCTSYFGCYKWFTDVGHIYIGRGCVPGLNAAPGGNDLVEWRFYAVMNALVDVLDDEEMHEGCYTSPVQAETMFGRMSSLFVHYHVCICETDYCNAASLPVPLALTTVAVAVSLALATCCNI